MDIIHDRYAVPKFVALWVVHRRMRRQKRERKYWVRQILKTMLSFSLYVNLEITMTHLQTTLECLFENLIL